MADPRFAPLKNDLLLRAARGEPTSRAPMWIMRQAGRYLPEYHKEKGNRDFFECCRNPEIASNLTIQPIDHFDGLIDAAIIFSDILVIPQAMGMEVLMKEKEGPYFPNPMRTPKDPQFEKVLRHQTRVKDDLGYVYQAITLTRQKLDGRVPLIGFCGAPWTLLSYMAEGSGSKMFFHAKTWIYKYPKESMMMLQKISDVCVEHLAQQVLAGAQMVQIFDSWAGELGPAAFREFSLPYLIDICRQLPKRLSELGYDRVPMTVFAKGAWYALEDLCRTGYDVISLDWLHEPAQAYAIARKYGKTLQGNADPGTLYGSEDSIRETVSRMAKGFAYGKQGWIANLGHGITPAATPEMLHVYLSEIKRQCENN